MDEYKAIETTSCPQPKPFAGTHAFIVTFGTDAFIEVLSVMQAVLIARVLGPGGRGEYAAVVLWPSFFASITMLGSNISIARAAARESQQGTIIRASVLLGLMTSSVGAIICYLLIPWLMPAAVAHLIPIARLFVLLIPLNHLALNLLAVDQGRGDFRRYNLMRVILNPVYLSLIILFWFLDIASVRWFVIALLIANGAVVVTRIFFAFREHRILGAVYSPIRLFKESLNFGLAGIANPIYAKVDQALLLWLLGTEKLGFYMVALSASSVVSSITSASGIVTFTMAAQSEHGEGSERITRAFRMSLLGWILLGTALAIVMPWALPLVYGEEFVPAITAARLLIIGSAFAGLSQQLEQAMRGQGEAFVGLEGRLVGLATMVVLAIMFAPVLGLEGVCIAFVIGKFLCLLFMMYRTNKHYCLASNFTAYVPRVAEVLSVIKAIRNYLFSIGASS